MNAVTILEKWAAYSHFDPEQRQFNLLSHEYELNRCNKRIHYLNEHYDASGVLGLIYAKNTFRRIAKEQRVSVFDVLNNPNDLREDFEMWALFNGKEMQDMENRYLDGLDQIVQQVTGKTMIGLRDRDSERESFSNAVDKIAEELMGCHEDLFLLGGEFKQINRASTHIHVFERLSECLLALEAAEDGIYLCYVAAGGNADGFFGFYLKSNGNLLSVNEQVNEAYAGQHRNSRNGRWSEEKKYSLFPYQYIFDFADHDYKGYASKHIINHEKLNFFQLDPDAYIPLVVSMVLLARKYAGTDLSGLPLKYVDSLMPINLLDPAPGAGGLVVHKDSGLTMNHQQFHIAFDRVGFMDGTVGKRLGIGDGGQLFVEMYGDGFQYEASPVLEANQYLRRLTDGREAHHAEFVGTAERLEVEAYVRMRGQLADYIRAQMEKEYLSFGGREGAVKWWRSSLYKNLDRIAALCVQKYQGIQSGATSNPGPGWRSTNEGLMERIYYQEDVTRAEGFWLCAGDYLNYRETAKRFKYRCNITGTTCNRFFIFRPNTWKDLEEITGEDVPPIIKGWQYDRHYSTNPILNASDAVEGIGTPFERNESHRLAEKLERDIHPYHFEFAIGFSKRGFNQLMKNARDGCAIDEKDGSQNEQETKTPRSGQKDIYRRSRYDGIH